MARNQSKQKAGSVLDGADGQFRSGSELREARERLGWDLGEVAAALRIKLSYLQAIEDGRVSALPGNAYALGFLRTYATTLGLDADDVARRFRAEAHDINRKTELAFPSPVPERGLPIGAMALLGLVILIAGYAAWYKFSEHEQVATHTVPPVPEQLLAAPKAAPVSPQVASVMPAPGSPTPHIPAPASPPQLPTPARRAVTLPPPTTSPPTTSPQPVTTTQATPAAPTHSTPAPLTTTTPATLPAPSGTALQAPPPSAPPANGLVLRATAPTWVQVRGPEGHVVYDHVMQAGDTWQVPPATPGLLMTTGNAGGLLVSDNGTDLGGFGRAGAVRHNIPLTEAGLKTALQPAAPPSSTPAISTPAATPDQPTLHLHPVHHVPTPSPPTDDSADQLNARQLRSH